MKASYRIVLLGNHISLGLVVPVFSLALLDHGATLEQLSLVFGAFSLSVFVMELPSGVMADLLGRKRIFLLSCLFAMLASLLMLTAKHIAWLFPAIVPWAAGRAFASGSIDALIIDEHIDTHGMQSVAAITSELMILETVGLSAGAFIGGFLPDLMRSLFPNLGLYDGNLILRGLSSGFVLVLGAFVLKDPPSMRAHPTGLKQHVAQSVRFVRTNRTVLLLLAGVFCSGIFLFTIETYWQPAYVALLPDGGMMWTLGLLTFGCFACATLGNLVFRRLFMRNADKACIGYWISRVALFVLLVIFSYQRSAAGFGILFCMLYLLLGGSNVAEGAMINAETPGESRASILSFSSLVLQFGGICAPLLAAVVVSKSGIFSLWGITGVVFAVASLLIGWGLYKDRLQREREGATGDRLPCMPADDKPIGR